MKYFNPLAVHTFALNDVPNHTEFTNLYRLYKINGIRVRFIPNVTSVPADANANATIDQIMQCSIYDPTVAPTTVLTTAALEQYQNLKIKTLLHDKTTSYYFKPKIPVDAAASTSSLFTDKKAGWLSTSDAAVPHYGPHIAWFKIDGTNWDTNVNDQYKFRMVITYYLAFKIVA